MNNNIQLRFWFVRVALAYLGTPYRWGGDDPTGFDCSGLVVECLKSVGLMSEHEDLPANGLWQRYRHTEVVHPRAGDLAFWLNDDRRAYHVAICLDEWLLIEAAGGGARVTSPEAAADAFVKIRPIAGFKSPLVFADPFAASPSEPAG